MQTYSATKIGANRNKPRIWLEGKRLDRAGFQAATRFAVDIDRESKRITLRIARAGERIVSSKTKDGRVIPIIDINNAELLSVFAGLDHLRVVFEEGAVHLLPLASDARKVERIERVRQKLANGQPLDIGSISTGIGVLDEAMHAGLAAAGIETRLAFALDIDQGYLDQCEAHNPVWNDGTVFIAAPLQEVAFDSWAMRRIPAVDGLHAGIPCTAHSQSGRAKKGGDKAEDDPQVGHLVAALLAMIAATNPLFITIENVVPYMSSASFAILKNQLTEWGYDVKAAVLKGEDFSEIETRNRMALVAMTKGIDFDFAMIEKPAPAAKRLSDYLEDIPADSPLWSDMAGMKAREAKVLERGDNFKIRKFSADANNIGTLTRGYARVRPTDPKIQHPTNPDLLRQLTPIEHARIKGICPGIIAGMSDTRAHEGMGQSVLRRPFYELGRAEAKAILNWFAATCSSDEDLFQLVAA